MAANCGNLLSLLVRAAGTLSADLLDDRPRARLRTRHPLKREQDAALGRGRTRNLLAV